MGIPEDLPEVGGRTLDCTLPAFEQRCRLILGKEQQKDSPDVGLIAVVCDAVRLSREYADYIKDHAK